MASLVDQLEAQDDTELNGRLALAAHDRTWARTFSSTPPTEVLRANRNYDELLNQAADRQLEIHAQTDPKAQKMLHASRLQPLKEELIRGQIDHQAASTLAAGATERFNRQKDTESMSHVVGFADYMTKAPEVSSPEYSAYVLKGVQKYPRMATTEWGKDTLKNIAAEHDTIRELMDQIPDGMKLKTVTIGKGQHVTAERDSKSDSTSMAKELKDGYGLTPGQLKNPVSVKVGDLGENGFVGNHKGNIVEIATGKPGETVRMSVPEYERFGGTFGKETIAARTAAPEQTAVPNISQDDYAKLPSGAEYTWNGKKLKKK